MLRGSRLASIRRVGIVSQSLGTLMGGDAAQREPKYTSYLSFGGHRLHGLVYRPHFISEKSEGPKSLSGLPRIAQPIEETEPGSGPPVCFSIFSLLLSGGKTSSWRCDYKEVRHRTFSLSSVLEMKSTAGVKMEQ